MHWFSDIHSVEDARRLARGRLPWVIFDYIDGSAGSETGAAIARQAFDNIRLCPRILYNVSEINLSKDALGQTTKLPFGISPMAMCNLAHPNADVALAALAAEQNIPLGVSTASTTSMETLLEKSNQNAWFQLYFSGDGVGTMKLVERAKRAGFKTLVLTVDVPELGRRPRELRHGFKMPFKIGPKQFIDFALHPYWTIPSFINGVPHMANFDMEGYDFNRMESRALADWSYLDQLRAAWPGNLVVKGVLNPLDAVTLVNAGVDAIQVSSHGSRQLDSAPAPIRMLGEIRNVVGSDFPLFYDSGIRSGEDIVKAYAMGADFVFLGRPFLYALAAKGEKGLKDLVTVLTQELQTTLAQIGQHSIKLIKQNVDDYIL